MIRMLEALEVRSTSRVLEIGTGTGFNAALLTHRLGAERVCSMDLDADLVEAARQRLATLGHSPTLITGDGAAGLPDLAPFDRLVATCSVPALPEAWADQVRIGGIVLVDLKRSAHAGNLVLLRRMPDGLEGRFLSRWAGFMAIRGAYQPPAVPRSAMDITDGTAAHTELDPLPWTAPIPWLLAHTRLIGNVAFGYQGWTDSGPEWAVYRTADGSWSAVEAHPRAGRRAVRHGGPMPPWPEFERAHRAWCAHGQPGWDRFGLTVTGDGEHVVWLDEPGEGPRWQLTR
jgi:protein-L-isoaspartate O-methyltransferase